MYSKEKYIPVATLFFKNMKNYLTVTNEYGFSNSEKRGGEMDLNVLGNTWMQMYAKKSPSKDLHAL